MNHIKKGGIGYSEFALAYPLKNKILCVDYARKKIKYNNENGDTIIDIGAKKLTERFFKAIDEKNNDLIDKYLEEINEKYEDIGERCMMQIRIVDNKIKVIEIKDGKTNDLSYEFVREICNKSSGK